jgi:hypothetical protein
MIINRENRIFYLKKRVFRLENPPNKRNQCWFLITVRLCPTRTAEMNFSVGEARGIYMKQKIWNLNYEIFSCDKKLVVTNFNKAVDNKSIFFGSNGHPLFLTFTFFFLEKSRFGSQKIIIFKFFIFFTKSVSISLISGAPWRWPKN